MAFEPLRPQDIAIALSIRLLPLLRLVLGTIVLETLDTVSRAGTAMPEAKTTFLPNQVGQMTYRVVKWTAINLAILPPREPRCKAGRKLIETEFALDIQLICLSLLLSDQCIENLEWHTGWFHSRNSARNESQESRDASRPRFFSCLEHVFFGFPDLKV